MRADFAWFDINNKRLGVAQIEMIGGEKLVGTRKAEILETLHQLKKELGLVACKPELTSRIFKLLKTIPDGSTEETFKRVLKGASSEAPMRQVANS
jgi:hypothetical protein